MDGGTWWATVHGVAKSRRRLSNFTFTHAHHAGEGGLGQEPGEEAVRLPFQASQE